MKYKLKIIVKAMAKMKFKDLKYHDNENVKNILNV
jgi:hypothetical protein